jgi:hypothetical protein
VGECLNHLMPYRKVKRLRQEANALYHARMTFGSVIVQKL